MRKTLKTAVGIWCLFASSMPAQESEYDYWQMGLVANVPYPYCSDVWGYTDENGHDFAVFGTLEGTVILDISTNPSNPVETGFIPGQYSYTRDLKTHGDYLYVTNEGGGGLDIIDLTDPWNPRLAKRYTGSGFNKAHNLFIADGFAYIVGSNLGAIQILDLEDPVNPVGAGSWQTTYIHDIYVKNDTAYACAIYDGDLHILDVSNKSDIQTLAVLDYDDYGTHAVWTTEDSKFIITADEKAGGHVKIWDAADYDDINLVSEYEVDQDKSVHNVFVRGDKLFVSYYVYGTRVVDISAPSNPTEVAYFDFYPGSDGTYAGNWGTYPFTRSGLIYSTSMSGDGFFVLQYNFYVEFSHEPLTDTEDSTGPYPVTVIMEAGDGNELVPDSAICVSGLNTNFTDTTFLVETVNPGEFTGNILGHGEAGVLTYYFAVQDTAGRWSFDPYGAPASYYSFNVGPDLIPPEIISLSTLENTVFFAGSQEIRCEVEDNIGILDVRLIWSKNGGQADSLTLTAGPDPQEYTGTFSWAGAQTGDVFDYFLRVLDDTQNRNVTDSDTFQFEIVTHITIGRFDDQDLTPWDTTEGWGLQYWGTDKLWTVNDSPGGDYPDNGNHSFTLKEPLDLSDFDQAYLAFWTIYALEEGEDSGYVEISTDGTAWDTLKTVTGLWLYEDVVLSLEDYVGEKEVYIRFRRKSNESIAYLGWIVDDIEFWVNAYPMEVDLAEVAIPTRVSLLPNVPNPFNPLTTITFELPYSAEIRLTVFDLLGRKVVTLAEGRREVGTHHIHWNASHMASGVYLYQLAVERDGVLTNVLTRKMTVLK